MLKMKEMLTQYIYPFIKLLKYAKQYHALYVNTYICHKIEQLSSNDKHKI